MGVRPLQPDSQHHNGSEFRRVSRKYRRQKRKARLRDRLGSLALHTSFLLLTAAAVAAVWFFTRPKPVPGLPERLRVCFLDVGQGDAALIRTEHHAVLIDAGDYEQGYQVVHMLKALGVTKLDAIISSHPHADHLGGMATLLQSIPAEAVYWPEIPQQMMPTAGSAVSMLEAAEKLQIPLRVPHCHDKLTLGETELEFLCTDNSAFENLNDCSLCCKITCGKVSFLFTGDLEHAGEAALEADNLLSPVTVLKIPHHGSSASTSADFLQAAAPQYAVISVGAMNDYGHPSDKCLQLLHQAGCTVYRTDLDGSIMLATDGETVQAVTNWDFGL